MIAIGWAKLGDLSEYQSDQQIEAEIKRHYRTSDDSRPVNDTRTCFDFAHTIKVGDVVIAKQGLSTILGVGTVISPYQFSPGIESEWPSRREVSWKKLGSWTLPADARVPVKTLTDVTEYVNFRTFLKTTVPDTKAMESASLHFPGFTDEAFDLLDTFRKNPIFETYTASRDRFSQCLSKAMKLLVKDLSPDVADTFGSAVETEKNVISQMHKNDFGKGGIHFHYWMAFYPKDVKRTTGTQLFVYLNPDTISAGFASGQKADAFLERLKEALDATDFDVPAYLDRLTRSDLQLANFDEGGRREMSASAFTGEDIAKCIESKKRIVVERVWTRKEAVGLGPSLAILIRQVFKEVMPLFAMASFDDCEKYLPDEGSDPGEPGNENGEPDPQTPPLTSLHGWDHLRRELHWSTPAQS